MPRTVWQIELGAFLHLISHFVSEDHQDANPVLQILVKYAVVKGAFGEDCKHGA